MTVAGLILAGSADFKTELGQSDMFDQRLQAKLIKTVDISYGGENGFNQVIFIIIIFFFLNIRLFEQDVNTYLKGEYKPAKLKLE